MGLMERVGMRNRVRSAGYLFFLIAFLVLLAAFNTGTNLLYLLLGGVLSFIVISVVLTFWNMRGISGTTDAPTFVERGAPFYIQARIENRRLLLPALGLRLEREGVAGITHAYVMKLGARRAAWVHIEESFPKRGVHKVANYRIVSSFPFGLFDRFQRIKSRQEILVHPRIQTVRTASFTHQSGARYLARQASGDGDEYFGLREYQPGDDMRHVAWRISARMGAWFIREWARDNSRFVIFALDTLVLPKLDGFEERFEDAVELTASLAITMLHRHYSVGVAHHGVIIEPAEGTSQERRILETLARVMPTEDDTPGFLDLLRDLENRRATVVCISPDPGRWGRRLSQGARYIDPREVIHA